MYKTILFIAIVLIFTSCKNEKTGSSTSDGKSTSISKDIASAPVYIEEEVITLTTIDLQKKFLEQIGELDLQVREDEKDAITGFGYESAEHNSARLKKEFADKVNLEKIEKYLDLYGYPALREQGRLAVDVPWRVIHHAGDIEAMHRNFKYVYKAHSIDRQLRDYPITTYLNHMYEIEFGEPRQWDRPFTVDEEMTTLMKALNLTVDFNN